MCAYLAKVLVGSADGLGSPRTVSSAEQFACAVIHQSRRVFSPSNRKRQPEDDSKPQHRWLLRPRLLYPKVWVYYYVRHTTQCLRGTRTLVSLDSFGVS